MNAVAASILIDDSNRGHVVEAILGKVDGRNLDFEYYKDAGRARGRNPSLKAARRPSPFNVSLPNAHWLS